jgi:hypothetical protein
MTSAVYWEADADSDSVEVKVVYRGARRADAEAAYRRQAVILTKVLGRWGGWALYLDVGGRLEKSMVAVARPAVGGWASWRKAPNETPERRAEREAWEAEVLGAEERRAGPGCLGLS